MPSCRRSVRRQRASHSAARVSAASLALPRRLARSQRQHALASGRRPAHAGAAVRRAARPRRWPGAGPGRPSRSMRRSRADRAAAAGTGSRPQRSASAARRASRGLQALRWRGGRREALPAHRAWPDEGRVAHSRLREWCRRSASTAAAPRPPAPGRRRAGVEPGTLALPCHGCGPCCGQGDPPIDPVDLRRHDAGVVQQRRTDHRADRVGQPSAGPALQQRDHEQRQRRARGRLARQREQHRGQQRGTGRQHPQRHQLGRQQPGPVPGLGRAPVGHPQREAGQGLGAVGEPDRIGPVRSFVGTMTPVQRQRAHPPLDGQRHGLRRRGRVDAAEREPAHQQQAGALAGQAGAAQRVFDAPRTAPRLRRVGGAQVQPADAALANRCHRSHAHPQRPSRCAALALTTAALSKCTRMSVARSTCAAAVYSTRAETSPWPMSSTSARATTSLAR